MYRCPSDGVVGKTSSATQLLTTVDMNVEDIDISLEDVLTDCSRSDGDCRKEGVTKLQWLLDSKDEFSPDELAVLWEIFKRLLAEQTLKIFGVFLDVLASFFSQHGSVAEEWLFVLMLRLLHKQGSMDLPNTISHKIHRIFEQLRLSFSASAQVNVLAQILLNKAQPMNSKTKLAWLQYFVALVEDLDSREVGSIPEFSQVVGKIVSVAFESKSPDIKLLAMNGLTRLYQLNTSGLMKAIEQLPGNLQNCADSILKLYLENLDDEEEEDDDEKEEGEEEEEGGDEDDDAFRARADKLQDLPSHQQHMLQAKSKSLPRFVVSPPPSSSSRDDRTKKGKSLSEFDLGDLYVQPHTPQFPAASTQSQSLHSPRDNPPAADKDSPPVNNRREGTVKSTTSTQPVSRISTNGPPPSPRNARRVVINTSSVAPSSRQPSLSSTALRAEDFSKVRSKSFTGSDTSSPPEAVSRPRHESVSHAERSPVRSRSYHNVQNRRSLPKAGLNTNSNSNAAQQSKAAAQPSRHARSKSLERKSTQCVKPSQSQCRTVGESSDSCTALGTGGQAGDGPVSEQTPSVHAAPRPRTHSGSAQLANGRLSGTPGNHPANITLPSSGLPGKSKTSASVSHPSTAVSGQKHQSPPPGNGSLHSQERTEHRGTHAKDVQNRHGSDSRNDISRKKNPKSHTLPSAIVSSSSSPKSRMKTSVSFSADLQEYRIANIDSDFVSRSLDQKGLSTSTSSEEDEDGCNSLATKSLGRADVRGLVAASNRIAGSRRAGLKKDGSKRTLDRLVQLTSPEGKTSSGFGPGVPDPFTDAWQSLLTRDASVELRVKALQTLLSLARNPAHCNWDEHSSRVLHKLMELMQADQSGEVKVLALRVLREVVKISPDLLKNITELVITKVLKACQDKEMGKVFCEEVLPDLARVLDTFHVLPLLVQFSLSDSYPLYYLAMRTLTAILPLCDSEVVSNHVQSIFEAAGKHFSDSEGSVRRAAVYLVVAVSRACSTLSRQYLARLSVAQSRLVHHYLANEMPREGSDCVNEIATGSSHRGRTRSAELVHGTGSVAMAKII